MVMCSSGTLDLGRVFRKSNIKVKGGTFEVYYMLNLLLKALKRELKTNLAVGL